jgi:hypothetical protein
MSTGSCIISRQGTAYRNSRSLSARLKEPTRPSQTHTLVIAALWNPISWSLSWSVVTWWWLVIEFSAICYAPVTLVFGRKARYKCLCYSYLRAEHRIPKLDAGRMRSAFKPHRPLLLEVLAGPGLTSPGFFA